jgi:hypothetical protein
MIIPLDLPADLWHLGSYKFNHAAAIPDFNSVLNSGLADFFNRAIGF